MKAVTDDGDGWDFADIVFDFVSHLPKTIRRDILALVVRYGCAARSQGEVSDLRKIGAALAQDPSPDSFGSILRIVSALDYVLVRTASTVREARPFLEGLLRDASPSEAPVFERSLLQLPLRQRHGALAAEEWSNLRATFLSARNLRKLETWCVSEFERRTLEGRSPHSCGHAR